MSKTKKQNVGKHKTPATAHPPTPNRRALRTIFFLAGVFLIASIILILTSPDSPSTAPPEPPKIFDTMIIQLAEPCAKIQKVLSNTPLVFEYGHWGFLPEYAQQNLESLLVEIYINGELAGQQEANFDLVPTTALPCVDLSEHSQAFIETGQWAYASLEHPGLTRGEYQVEIVYYLRERLATGLKDQNGDLVFYGPGEVQRIRKELAVE